MSAALKWLGLRLLLLGLVILFMLSIDDLMRSTFHCVFLAPHKGFCYFW